MNGLMEYKGYYGSANFSEEDMVFHGKLEFIRDLVLYESDIAKGIVKEFHDAVDDYLDFCKEQGNEPDKPFKGVFNVRVRPELHRDAALLSSRAGITLNKFVTDALEEKLERAGQGSGLGVIVSGEVQEIIEKFHEGLTASKMKIERTHSTEFQFLNEILSEIINTLESAPSGTFSLRTLDHGIALLVLTKSVRLMLGISEICQNGYAEEGSILLRSLLEHLFNLGYINAGETEKRATLFLEHDWVIRYRMLKTVKSLDPETFNKILKNEDSTFEEIGNEYSRVKDNYKKADWSGLSIREKAKRANLEPYYLIYMLCSNQVHGNSRSSLKIVNEYKRGGLEFDFSPSERAVAENLVATADAIIRILDLVLNIFEVKNRDVIEKLAGQFQKTFKRANC